MLEEKRNIEGIEGTEGAKGKPIEQAQEVPDFLKEGLDFDLDASSSEVSLKPPLAPIVKEKEGKKQVILPRGSLVRVEAYKNKNANSKGYFKGLQMACLIFEFKGYKTNPKEVDTFHSERFNSIDPNVNGKDVLLEKFKKCINHLYVGIYGGNANDLAEAGKRAKQAATKFAIKEKIDETRKEEYLNELYYLTFVEYAKLFNEGNEGKPIFFKDADGVDENGNPHKNIVLWLHISVYKNYYQLAIAPFAEIYQVGVKPGLKADVSRNEYEKSEKKKPIAKGMVGVNKTMNGGNGSESELDNIDDIDFE